jgi:hypothetical protein
MKEGQPGNVRGAPKEQGGGKSKIAQRVRGAEVPFSNGLWVA